MRIVNPIVNPGLLWSLSQETPIEKTVPGGGRSWDK